MKIFERTESGKNRYSGRIALALALTFTAGIGFAGPPADNLGRPFEQLEAKLDRIEAKLDAESPIPPPGTEVIEIPGSTGVFNAVVNDTGYMRFCDGTPISQCSCKLDGLAASCTLVLACLEAGLCTCDIGCD